MRMTYNIPGRGMFHTDCKESGSGIMKDLHKSKPDDDGTTLHAYECLHCHEIGWYGIQEKTRVIIVKGESEPKVIDELDNLECRYCDNTIYLKDNEPEKAGWTLIGFGVWYCPDCKIKHNVEIGTNAEFFSSVGCLLAEGVEFYTRTELYNAIKKEWHKYSEIKRKSKL